MIRVQARDGVLRLTLARPEKRNALTPEALQSLAEHATFQPAGVHAVLLLGEGPAFCAGFDLDLCAADDDTQPTMRRLLEGLSAAIVALRAQPLPVVACAHGAAVAGGCALLGAADVVVADRGARLGYPVTRLGISPAVSAPFARQGLGDGGARARLLDPGLITADRAHALGLVHELTGTPAEALDRASQIARGFAAKPPHAVAATRSWLDAVAPPCLVDEALRESLSLTSTPEALGRLRSGRNPA